MMNHDVLPENRLAGETSPYLRQHSRNPVDWYPWGREALELARRENKPIFLSIGYSACHWCHVMEQESFMDAETATLLNAHFVSIKVDREERPDLDQIYMNAVTAMTGHGGWPMSVFLTPDLEPFFAGTYFPPDDRYPQLPSFKRLLRVLAAAWKERGRELAEHARQIADHLCRQAVQTWPAAELTPELLRSAVDRLQAIFDPVYGGFGKAPKFPHPLELRLLWRAWKRFGNENALHMVQHTLEMMARGGIYDHLGGGFHRYSTDERWLVPHFEKMLYDNALLAQVYVEAWQATGMERYRRVAEETLDWVIRDMTSPEGAFYSSVDADSQEGEGEYYVWSAAEAAAILGPDLFDLFASVYDISQPGNWEGKNILHQTKSMAQSAGLWRMSAEELAARLAEGRQRLWQARCRRPPPARDDKIIACWNGLMIDALAQAGAAIAPRYTAAAVSAAQFIVTRMRGPDRRLFRIAGDAAPGKIAAFLEDYAAVAHALTTLYQTTFQLHWLQAALELAETMIEQFADAAGGGFFFTGRNHEQLLVRSKSPEDGATPSGNSLAASVLLRLAHLTGRQELRSTAERILTAYGSLAARQPAGFGQLLAAVDFYLGPVDEIVVRGDDAEVLRIIQSCYRPNQVLAGSAAADGSEELARHAAAVPLLAGKTTAAGRTAVYFCRRFTCEPPITDLQTLARRLAQ